MEKPENLVWVCEILFRLSLEGKLSNKEMQRMMTSFDRPKTPQQRRADEERDIKIQASFPRKFRNDMKG